MLKFEQHAHFTQTRREDNFKLWKSRNNSLILHLPQYISIYCVF